MAKLLLRPGVRRREVWAWAMYDFANSGYTTVVITAVFDAYFVGVVAGNAPWATFAWTAGAVGVLRAGDARPRPLVGAWADAHAAKKTLLGSPRWAASAPRALLAFRRAGRAWRWRSPALIVSNFFYCIGENLSPPSCPSSRGRDALGKVSGWGWALRLLRRHWFRSALASPISSGRRGKGEARRRVRAGRRC